MPLSLVILIGLFMLQSRGTHKIGVLFGPLMLFWFLALAGLGAMSLWNDPTILLAINPLYTLDIFLAAPWVAFVSLGAVVVVDAVASRHLIDHETALRRLEGAGAVPITSEAVLFEWCRSAEHPQFQAIRRLVLEGSRPE